VGSHPGAFLEQTGFSLACHLLYLAARDLVAWNTMLRITVVESSNETVRLRIEGRVTTACVEELRRSCEIHALNEGIRLFLDLADVSFADAEGVKLLNDLKSQGVAFIKLAPFLALQLRNATGGLEK
jgi:hypothetical protein